VTNEPALSGPSPSKPHSYPHQPHHREAAMSTTADLTPTRAAAAAALAMRRLGLVVLWPPERGS